MDSGPEGAHGGRKRDKAQKKGKKEKDRGNLYMFTGSNVDEAAAAERQRLLDLAKPIKRHEFFPSKGLKSVAHSIQQSKHEYIDQIHHEEQEQYFRSDVSIFPAGA